MFQLMVAVLALSNVATPLDQKKVIGYYSPYSLESLKVLELNAAWLTHLIYAFANINLDGTTSFSGPGVKGGEYAFWAESRRMEKYERYCGCDGNCLKGYLNQVYKMKRENPHLRTILSIGGYAWSANFSAVMGNNATRRTAVLSTTQMMIDYGFDGLDIDWEYPTDTERPVTEPNFTHSSDDWLNYAQFLTEVRDYWKSIGLPDDTLLSIAGDGFLEETGKYKAATAIIQKLLSFVLVMSYEYQQNPNATRLGAQLQPHEGDVSGELTVDYAMEVYAKYYNKSQLILGVPLYAAGFYGFQPGTGQRNMPCLGDNLGDSGSAAPKLSYRDVITMASSSDFNGYDVSLSRGQAGICDNKTFYNFDSPETILQKAKFVQANGLGGMMLWDLSQDVTDPQYSIAAAAQKAFNFTTATNRTFNDFCMDGSKFCNIQCSYTPEKATAYIEANKGSSIDMALAWIVLVLL